MEILCEEKVMEMVKGAKLSDEENLKKLIEYFTPYIKSKCSKYNIHGYDYEDIASEGVRTLLKCIDNYNFGKCSFTPYFFRALTNELNYLLRKSYNYDALGQKIQNSEERVCQAVDVEDKLYKEELSKEISGFIRGLTEIEKEVIEDIYYKEKTIAEVARNMDYPFHKVQHIRNIVLKKMRNNLSNIKA